MSPLTLNRPKQFNALSVELLSALQTETDSIAQDDNIRVVVIAANGKAFCAGHTQKRCAHIQMKQFSAPYSNNAVTWCSLLIVCRKVIIAKVQASRQQQGANWSPACDLAVAAADAKFATSGINVGFCSTPAVAVSRNLPRKQAFEMLITGEFIDAHTALQYGLINRLAPAEQLEQVLQSLITAITVKSPVAVKLAKTCFISSCIWASKMLMTTPVKQWPVTWWQTMRKVLTPLLKSAAAVWTDGRAIFDHGTDRDYLWISNTP